MFFIPDQDWQVLVYRTAIWIQQTFYSQIGKATKNHTLLLLLVVKDKVIDLGIGDEKHQAI